MRFAKFSLMILTRAPGAPIRVDDSNRRDRSFTAPTRGSPSPAISRLPLPPRVVGTSPLARTSHCREDSSPGSELAEFEMNSFPLPPSLHHPSTHPSSTCRSAPEGKRTTAEDPAGRLAGRAHPWRDSRGGVPRRALASHREGRADHDVPESGELRGLQRPGRRGQPGRGGRGRGCGGRSR